MPEPGIGPPVGMPFAPGGGGGAPPPGIPGMFGIGACGPMPGGGAMPG